MTLQDVLELLFTGGTFESSGPPVDYPSREVERKAIDAVFRVELFDTALGATPQCQLVSAYQEDGRIIITLKELT